LLICYIFSFGAYLILIHRLNKESLFSVSLGLAMLLRLSLFFSPPSLSDDYHRFFWDGHLTLHGENPYLSPPFNTSSKIIEGEYFENLLSDMNSPNYHSVYPPLNQLFFAISARIGGQHVLGNLLVMRIIYFLFEILNIWLLIKILHIRNMPKQLVFIYALNPLVLLEGIGNLHLEVVVLSGILALIWALLKNKPIYGGFAWALAVGLKLVPLILGLVLWKNWPIKTRLLFFATSGIFGFLFLAYLIPAPTRFGFLESIQLYQQNFEFNASFYYLLRAPLQWCLGYNPIAQLVPLMQWIMLVLVVLVSLGLKGFKHLGMIEKLVWVYFIYLVFQPVVHPWYLIPAFGLSILTKEKVFFYWTGLVFLSYHAYANPEVREIGWVLAIEYGVLAILMLWEKGERVVRG
jgi:alpha-1,6-mannosyltransferase